MSNSLTYRKQHSFKTKKGMEVVFLEDHSSSIYLQLDIQFGSLDLNYIFDDSEIELAPGIAHFLEHKIFAMENGEDAFTKLTSLGLQANAMTSYQTTSYTLVGNENMKQGIGYLLNMLNNPYFTDTNVEQEYNIIAEEIRMYDDDIDSYIQNVVLNMMYHDHPIKHDIAGTVESIEFITPEMLLKAYEYFYQPSNRKLYMSGNFNFEEYERYILNLEEYEGIDSPIEKPVIYELSEVKESFKALELPNIKNKLSLGIKLNYETDDKVYMLKEEIKAVIALNMLIGSLSDFYQQTLDEEILTEQMSFQLINEKNIFGIFLQGDTNDIETLDYMLKETLITPSEGVLNESVFDKVKRILIGHHIFSVNEFEYKLYLFSKYNVINVTLDQIVDYIKEVTLTDIENFISTISLDMFSTLYVYSNDENQ